MRLEYVCGAACVAFAVCCCRPGDIPDSHQLISYLADISPLRVDVWLRRRLDASVNNNSLHILSAAGLRWGCETMK